MDNTIDLKHLLSACINAAKIGGQIAREVVHSGNLQVKEKTGPNDVLSIADLKVQSFIIGELLHLWPNLYIIGEESVAPQSQVTEKLNIHDLDSVEFKVPTLYSISDLTLFIDPIDATKEFTEGLYSNVTILIGIASQDKAIAGVVFQPWSEDNSNASTGKLAWGIVGHGLEGIEVSQRVPDINNIILTTTRTHSSKELSEGISLIRPAIVNKIGGCGYKILLVIAGKADVYYFPTRGTNKWDTCGPEALLRCVGGTLTDREGNLINYGRHQPSTNDNGIIVTLNPSCHHLILRRLKGLESDL